jgi:hypothetical protein
MARHGKAWQGMAWQGMARHGKAWQGMARHGKAWQDIAEERGHRAGQSGVTRFAFGKSPADASGKVKPMPRLQLRPDLALLRSRSKGIDSTLDGIDGLALRGKHQIPHGLAILERWDIILGRDMGV